MSKRGGSRRAPEPAHAAPGSPGPVLTAFFLSGAAGLMHQVVWSKLLAGLIGTTGHAQAIVLAVFMGGLALGSALYGRRVDRRGHPARTYVRLELLIGAYCMLLPLLIVGAGRVYVAMASLSFDVRWMQLLLRFTLAVVVVLLPAVLMGATLPVLARYLVGGPDDTRREVSRLYGLNSLGAVLGAGAAGFVTLPALGIVASVVAASSLNLLAGAIMAPAARRETAARSEPRAAAPSAAEPEPPQDAYSGDQYLVTLVALALSGFAAMGYEVLFVRVIALSSGLSAQSFTIMLMSFITGISLGSLILSRIRVRRPLWWLAVTQLLVVGALLAVTPLVSRLPYSVALLRIRFHGVTGGFELFQVGKAALFLAVLLVPTTCLGFSFPLVAHVQARRSPRIGSHVGSTYAWNTVGNVLGAVLTSLLLLPWLGSLGSFHVCFALNLAAGVALLAVAREVPLRARFAAGSVAAGVVSLYLAVGTAWLEPVVLARNHLRLNERPPDADESHPSSSFAAWKAEFVAREEGSTAFFLEEDEHTTVLVYGYPHQITLFVNGKPDASTGKDLPTQLFLGHLPLMLNPDARRLLVIGHGSGITAAAALRHPIEHADIVEISRGVLDADRLFADFNYDVLKDPRVQVHLEDGQNFLRAVPERYDVIISEPSNPWIMGVSGLFTVEYFRAIRRRLNPGGVATIWFHEYEQDRASVEMVLRTIKAAFPYVEVCRAHNYADIILVASSDRIVPDFAKMEDRFDDPAVRGDLSRVGITTLMTLVLHHALSTERLQSLLRPGPLNTVWHQRLEYAAPRAFFLGVRSDYVQDADDIWNQREPGPDTLFALYAAYRERVGAPVTREELLEVAQNEEFLGGPSEYVGRVVTALAERYPTAAAPPARPARGALPDPATAGMFEASYWSQRLAKEGRTADERRFTARLDRLIREWQARQVETGG